jgi:hypothetical protein
MSEVVEELSLNAPLVVADPWFDSLMAEGLVCGK